MLRVTGTCALAAARPKRSCERRDGITVHVQINTPMPEPSGAQICWVNSTTASKTALSQNSPRWSVLGGHLKALDAPKNRLDKQRTGVSGPLESRRQAG
jgi:hypothetical protein